MKKLKFIMLSVFLLIVILLLGETTYPRLEQQALSQLYTVDAEFVDKSSFAEALKGFEKCGIIYEYGTVSDDLSRNIKVYYSGISEDDLRDKLGLSTLEFRNLTTGKCSYELYPLSELVESELYDEVSVYCDGDEAAARELADVLKGSARSSSYRTPSGKNDYTFIFEVVWALVIVMTVAVTVYDIFSQQKTAAVSLVLGSRIREIVLKNILADTAGITLSFAAVSLILSFFTAVNMNISSIVFHNGVLVAINSLCYLLFYKTNIFKALRDGEPGAKLLKFNYILKAVSALGVIAAAVYCVSSLAELKDDLAAYNKMKSLQGYSYINIQLPVMQPETDEEWEKYLSQKDEYWELFDKIADEYGSITLCSAYLQPELMDKSRQFVFADDSAFDIISDSLPELTEREGTFLFIPDDADDRERTSISEYIGDTQAEQIRYESRDILVLQSPDVQKAVTYRSPIVLYSSDRALIGELTGSSEKVIRIDDKQFDELVKKYADKPLIFERTDVFENYLHYKGSAEAFALILSLALGCAVMFELVLLISILTLEYKVNAKEICLKKVLGIGMLERNRKLIILTVLTNISGAATAFLLLDKFGKGAGMALWGYALILCIAELIITLIKASRIEKVNTAKILKGGAL